MHFQRAWQLGPPTAELFNDMGYRLYLEGRLAEAESVFRQALFLEPRHVAATLNLGRVLARQGRIAESLAVFRQVNGEAEAEANVAYVLADWGNISAAQAHYGRAGEIAVAQRQGWQSPPAVARLPFSGPVDTTLAPSQSQAAPAATARITQVKPV
jgi:Flp pilus assembly protein TadD